MSSTKNTVDDPKIVVVKYYSPYSIFKIPKNVDLNDTSIVKKWFVQNGDLHIQYIHGI